MAGLLIGFLVARQGAIQNAIDACNPGYGLQPVTTPTAFQIQLTTLGRAWYPQQESNSWKYPELRRLVWVVELKGSWIVVGGPAPVEPDSSNPNAAQKRGYTDTCTQIIDALTGESWSGAIE